MLKDMTGQKFGRLTVIKQVESEKDAWGDRTFSRWLCECECGNKKIVKGIDLRRGAVRSCGCLHRPIVRKEFYGKTRTENDPA